MRNILLLEDLPEIRSWLKSAGDAGLPERPDLECARVHDALALVSAQKFDLALIDLGLPDGSGVDVVSALREAQPEAQSVIVTIHDDDEHLFPALQAGAYRLHPEGAVARADHRAAAAHQPGRAAAVAVDRAQGHRVLRGAEQAAGQRVAARALTERESEVLLRVAKGFTLPEIGVQLGLSRHTIADYVKQIYRKLNVSSRAEAALEAQRLGLFGRR